MNPVSILATETIAQLMDYRLFVAHRIKHDPVILIIWGMFLEKVYIVQVSHRFRAVSIKLFRLIFSFKWDLSIQFHPNHNSKPMSATNETHITEFPYGLPLDTFKLLTGRILDCRLIVFVHFYSASHSMSLSEALSTTAIDTVSELTLRSAADKC